MGVSPDGQWLVNTSETTNMAHFIDLGTREVVANVLVDQRPRVAQFTPDGKQVWVSSEIGGTVSIIDVSTKEKVKVIGFEIPGLRKESIQPVGIRISGDGKRAFVEWPRPWPCSWPRPWSAMTRDAGMMRFKQGVA
jgi:DNA-binding beta-propeller fold protein YncE